MAKNQLRRTLRGLFYTKDYIKSITIITENGTQVFYDQLTGYTNQNSWMGSLGMTMDQLYEEIAKDNDTHIISTRKAGAFASKEHYLFHIGHRLINYKQIGEQIGIVVVSIDEQLLEEVCNSSRENENTLTFLVDREGCLVSFPDDKLLNSRLLKWDDDKTVREEAYRNFVMEQKIFDGDYISVHSIYDSKFDWDIVKVSNQNEVVNRLYGQQRIMTATSLAALIMLLIIIGILTRNLTISLKNVVGAMKQAGAGNLAIRVDIDPKMPAEVETIAGQFNRMLEKLKTSLEKEKEAGEKQRDAEIAALEAQLNPHFLYNTLDTINWMAIDREEYEISNSIGVLARILRYGIDNSNGIVTVQEETAWLKEYLFLQQIRLKNSFECVVSVEPEVLQQRIHKLLLQPFVENSIIHGFEGIDRSCRLTVKISAADNKGLEIIIYDNGIGMARELVDQMNRGIYNQASDKNHIGMENAINRIHMYYGEDVMVEIRSEENSYTEVRLRLPEL